MISKLLKGVAVIVANIYTLILHAQVQPLPANYAANTPVNFIRTWDATAPEQDANALITRPVKDVKQATQYIDGLGRPIQTVARMASLVTSSNTFADMVSTTLYDEFGREQYKYLPSPANNTGGNASITDGAFKLNPFEQQQAFYSDANGVLKNQGEQYFYSKTNFEASPLNRPTESFASGNSWAGSSSLPNENDRRSTKIKYWINTINDQVRIWNVNEVTNDFGSYSSPGAYPAGELMKSVMVDEHGKQVIEFKDKEGKVILKKVQIDNITNNINTADDGSGRNNDGWLCTYYIYDDLNQLRCVVQPEAVKLLPTLNFQLSTVLLAEQCFRYEYDQRQRMIRKKVPGAGEVYMVYNTRDRLVMTQDANLRFPPAGGGGAKWLVTKYDFLNRPIETGLWADANTFATHLNNAYNSSSYPNTASNYETLTITHYDDYSSLPAGLSATYLTNYNTNFANTNNTTWPYPQMPTQSNATKGMVTWSQVKVLGTANQFLSTVLIYDDKGRAIQTQAINSTGGLDVNTTQYTWAGQPLVTVTKTEKAGASVQTNIIVSQITYDDLGRVLKTEKKVQNTLVNGNTMPAFKTIIQNEYDALGQLKTKKLAPTSPSAQLETLTYEYNIRGWMLGMNRGYAKDDPNAANNYFGFDLGYDKANNNLIGSQTYATPQYNGNIEGMVWKSKGDGEKRKYDFVYDNANRLLRADFKQYTSGAFNQNAGVNYDMKMGDGNTHSTAYDANGNILKMQQWGLKINSSVQIDNLTYTYNTSSNKLLKVSDAITGTDNGKLGDFKDAAASNTTNDYLYDVNGNMNADDNKAISNIAYNHLNLPSQITIIGKGNITYTYDAAGNKLKKQCIETPNASNNNKTITTITNYVSGLVYESKTTQPANTPNDDYTDRLQFLPHEEGRIRFKPQDGAVAASLQYDYMLKDHLGNVRVVLTEEQKIDIYPAATLENTSITVNGVTSTAVAKESEYYNIDNTKIVTQGTASGIPVYQNNNGITNNNPYSNTTANSARLYRLNAATNTVPNKTGLGIVLKVMAGDNVNVFGKSYHKKPNATGYTNPINPLIVSNIIDLFTGTSLIGGKGVSTSQITGQSGFPTNVTNLLTNQPPQNSNLPRASINWIVFDEQFKYISGGFDMVGTATNTTGTFKNHTPPTISIPKNGYIYVYCSNESQYPVYFDNVQVVHARGSLIEESSYYPFGLVMSGISSKAAGGLENKYKYNGIEYNNDFDLNIGETFYRSHDPQIGRWLQIDPKVDKFHDLSPYMAMGNNPISIVDPRGDEIPITVYDDNGKKVKKKDVTSEQISKLTTMYQNEYGISVSYNSKKGTLVYAGEAKTDLKVSADAKSVMMGQLEKGKISDNKIAIGTGMAINTQTNEVSFGNKSASGSNVLAGPAVTLGKTSYFDMGLVNSDLSMTSKSFTLSTLDGNSADAARATNFARIFEHDFIGHNVNKILTDGPRNGYGSSPGPVEALVNTYRVQMGLGSFQATNYMSPGAGGTAIKYYGESGKTNAVLQVNIQFPR
jgi:RHS repeat-associated protein